MQIYSHIGARIFISTRSFMAYVLLPGGAGQVFPTDCKKISSKESEQGRSDASLVMTIALLSPAPSPATSTRQ